MYQAKSGVKNFSLYQWGGGTSTKNFFSSLNMYQAKSGVKNFSLYCGGGGPSTKFFFPVWTCIKPNLVSKIFPFTETGYPPHPRLDWDPPLSKAGLGPPPIQDWNGEPPPIQGWIGTPPIQDWIGTLPPLSKAEGWIGTTPPPEVNRQTFPSINITFPRTTYAGGNKFTLLSREGWGKRERAITMARNYLFETSGKWISRLI